MAKSQMNFTNLDFKETAELAELHAKMNNLNAETVNFNT
jgi:hypothetical protein